MNSVWWIWVSRKLRPQASSLAVCVCCGSYCQVDEVGCEIMRLHRSRQRTLFFFLKCPITVCGILVSVSAKNALVRCQDLAFSSFMLQYQLGMCWKFKKVKKQQHKQSALLCWGGAAAGTISELSKTLLDTVVIWVKQFLLLPVGKFELLYILYISPYWTCSVR